LATVGFQNILDIENEGVVFVVLTDQESISVEDNHFLFEIVIEIVMT